MHRVSATQTVLPTASTRTPTHSTSFWPTLTASPDSWTPSWSETPRVTLSPTVDVSRSASRGVTGTGTRDGTSTQSRTRSTHTPTWIAITLTLSGTATPTVPVLTPTLTRVPTASVTGTRTRSGQAQPSDTKSATATRVLATVTCFTATPTARPTVSFAALTISQSATPSSSRPASATATETRSATRVVGTPTATSTETATAPLRRTSTVVPVTLTTSATASLSQGFTATPTNTSEPPLSMSPGTLSRRRLPTPTPFRDTITEMPSLSRTGDATLTLSTDPSETLEATPSPTENPPGPNTLLPVAGITLQAAIGDCRGASGSLVLNASTSAVSAGATITAYTWDVAGASAALAAHLQTQTAAVAYVPHGLLPAGRVEVRLVIVDSHQQIGRASTTITYQPAGVGLAEVRIPLPNSGPLLVPLRNVVDARVVVPCHAGGAVPPALYQWTLSSMTYGTIAMPASDQPELILAPYRLAAAATYTAQFVAYASGGALRVRAEGLLTTGSQPLVAVISGGDRRVSAAGPLRLDASASIDPDVAPGNRPLPSNGDRFVWAVCKLSAAARQCAPSPSGSQALGPSVGAVYEAVGPFPLGDWLFTVNYTQGLRAAETNIVITFVAGTVPEVCLHRLTIGHLKQIASTKSLWPAIRTWTSSFLLRKQQVSKQMLSLREV